MPLFSSPSGMKCKSFQSCSPSALEIINSFTPCHRASFGVGLQPPGRIWGGRDERSVTQAVWLLASQQRCLQLPEAIKASSIIFGRSLYFQHLPAAWLISRLAQLMRLCLCHSMKCTGDSLAHTAAVGSAPAHLPHRVQWKQEQILLPKHFDLTLQWGCVLGKTQKEIFWTQARKLSLCPATPCAMPLHGTLGHFPIHRPRIPPFQKPGCLYLLSTPPA